MKTPKIDRPDQDDCNCGKPLKIDDQRRKQVTTKKVVKKRNLLK